MWVTNNNNQISTVSYGQNFRDAGRNYMYRLCRGEKGQGDLCHREKEIVTLGRTSIDYLYSLSIKSNKSMLIEEMLPKIYKWKKHNFTKDIAGWGGGHIVFLQGENLKLLCHCNGGFEDCRNNCFYRLLCAFRCK